MIKKITKLMTLILTSTLLLVGCNNTSSASKETDNNLSIVTSFYPLYISTLNIIKDVPNVELVNMTKPQTGCLHDYQLTPQDLKTLEKADIFVANGAGMESFLDKVISQFDKLNIIESSKRIEIIQTSEDEEVNAHVWVSISKNIQQVKNIANELSTLDPDNKDKYQSNANEYINKLETLKTKMHEELSTITNRDIVTFHEAFPYFAQEFNLNIAGVIETEPDSEPSAKEMEDIINTIKTKNIKSLFIEPQYSSRVAYTIADETGAKVYTLDPIVTGEANENSYNDYIDKMEKNLETLKEALK